MKVGIIGAMEQEVTLLRDQIENRQTIQRAGCEIYTGQIGGVDVALLKSGIGKVSAAMGTTLLLEHCSPDVVINTGSAGGGQHAARGRYRGVGRSALPRRRRHRLRLRAGPDGRLPGGVRCR